MVGFLELTTRRSHGGGQKALVNPEHVAAVLPQRTSSSAVYGSRIILVTEDQVGSVRVPTAIDVEETVDEIASRIREIGQRAHRD